MTPNARAMVPLSDDSGAGRPTPDARREFRPPGETTYDRSGPYRWIVSHVFRYPIFVTSFLASALLVNVLRSAVPVLTGLAFDVVMAPGDDRERLLALALGILGVVAALTLFDLTSTFSVEVLGQRLERDAREELYISLLGKSQTFHNRQRVGDIMARTANDVRMLNPMMNPGVALILDSFMSLVVPIVFIGRIRPELLGAPLLWMIAFLWALRRYSAQLNPVTAEMRTRFGEMNADLAETISGIEVVKSTAQEDAEKAKFDADATRYRQAFVHQGQIQARYLPPLLLAIALAVAFLHGVGLVGRGMITVGDLIAYLGLMGMLRYPSFISIFTFSLLQIGIAGAERILALIREETELDENDSGHRADIIGEIVFDDVTFSYEGKPVLEHVSFTAAPGETVAIVGQAGSGKTTLTRLVARIYDVEHGRILIDGVDVRDWSLESLRSQISTIEQDVFLFSRSVAENIGFGLGQRADRAEVEDAATAAQADDFISRLPEGYDTVIGERGAMLSGGQRQRLAIARALLTDPRILILDDSTSAIDSATEDEIQNAIRRVQHGRTALMITHRLSQIRWADRILILEGGHLMDQGTHDELIDRSDLYRGIFARFDDTREEA